MNTIVTIDVAGRVVIPKTVREELRLEPGDTLALDADGERLMLRPVRAASALRKERGIWVFRSGRKLSAEKTNETLEQVRHERNRAGRGSSA